MKPRLIPVVLVGACLLLGVKLVDAWTVLHAHAATAQPQPAPQPQPPAKPAAAPQGAPAADAAAAGAASGPDPAQTATPDPLLMSPEEIDLLQKLSARRAELDKRAQDISQQEVLLKAAEKRIDDKINKLSTIENGIGVKVQQKEQEDAERIKGLVKIYETMKPRDAARIFDGLDMPVLLDVVDHMKEIKVAPILASMDSDRAKQITEALAARRQQRGQAADAAAAKSPPAQAATP